jgi:hypothetical protein
VLTWFFVFVDVHLFVVYALMYAMLENLLM